MNKKTVAKLLGYGQLVIAYANQILSSNGGMIPQTRQQWLTLIGSIVLAGGVHLSSETSAGHPNGAEK